MMVVFTFCYYEMTSQVTSDSGFTSVGERMDFPVQRDWVIGENFILSYTE